MMQQEPLYITGHIHPDTDSVASAIGYAFLKRAMGIPAKACRLGNLNTETRYLLERFHFEEPEFATAHGVSGKKRRLRRSFPPPLRASCFLLRNLFRVTENTACRGQNI